MLNELDKELERREHKFVRYADDCIIFCKSKKSAERTMENLIPYIEKKLFLRINRTKTTVSHVSKKNILDTDSIVTKGSADLEYIRNLYRK